MKLSSFESHKTNIFKEIQKIKLSRTLNLYDLYVSSKDSVLREKSNWYIHKPHNYTLQPISIKFLNINPKSIISIVIIRPNCYQLFKDLVLISISFCFIACRFRGERGEEKFVRLREDAQKGSEAFRISAFPRSGFKIQALDGVSKNTFLFQVHSI